MRKSQERAPLTHDGQKTHMRNKLFWLKPEILELLSLSIKTDTIGVFLIDLGVLYIYIKEFRPLWYAFLFFCLSFDFVWTFFPCRICFIHLNSSVFYFMASRLYVFRRSSLLWVLLFLILPHFLLVHLHLWEVWGKMVHFDGHHSLPLHHTDLVLHTGLGISASMSSPEVYRKIGELFPYCS